MNTPPISEEQARAYVRRLENPYASLSLPGEADEGDSSEIALNKKRAYLKKLANPYATDAILGEPKENQMQPSAESAPQVSPGPRSGSTSKKAFQDGCRRIFVQYVPPEEGRVLRPHYRHFITRNEHRSPNDRFRLLRELSKYDISTSGNFQPHFNREQELLTAEKLQQIERAVLTVSASR